MWVLSDFIYITWSLWFQHILQCFASLRTWLRFSAWLNQTTLQKCDSIHTNLYQLQRKVFLYTLRHKREASQKIKFSFSQSDARILWRLVRQSQACHVIMAVQTVWGKPLCGYKGLLSLVVERTVFESQGSALTFPCVRLLKDVPVRSYKVCNLPVICAIQWGHWFRPSSYQRCRFSETSMHRRVVQGWSFAFMSHLSSSNIIRSRKRGKYCGKFLPAQKLYCLHWT